MTTSYRNAVLLSLWAASASAQSDRIAAIFAPYARNDAPGCAAGVFRAGRVIYSGAFGMADVAQHIPLNDSTVFAIASTTKQFIAFAALLLESDGKIGLDDDVRRYIPELPVFGPTITIRQLLQHTSGLRDSWNLFDMAGWRISDGETASDMLWLIERQRGLNHAPGTEFLYTGTGYFLLALITERASGTPIGRYLAERIFRPLGMTRSGVKTDADQIIEGLAPGYWGHDPKTLSLATRPFAYAGGTGVFTTIRDLARWDANFYAPQVGTRAIQDSMSAPGHLNDGTPIGYGMGLFIARYRGRPMISHAGSDPGYKADFIRFPEDSLTVTVLCNAFDIAPTPLALQIADLYLAERAEAVATPATTPGSGPEIATSLLAGLYRDAASGNLHRFYFEKDRLLIDGGGEGNFALAPLGHNAYRLTAAPRRYVLTFARRPAGLEVIEDIEGSPLRTYAQVFESRLKTTPLRSLTGVYGSPELEVSWRFVLQGGRLVLQRHRMAPDSLTHLFGDVFQTNHGFMLEFRPGSVDVTTERVRRLRFFRKPGAAPNPY